MDDKFYQHIILESNAIVERLGCKDINSALAKLEDLKEAE